MADAVLIVDDELSVLAAIRRALMDEKFDIVTAGSGEEGLKLLKTMRFKVVISDEMMPGMNGSEFLSFVRSEYPDTIRIILTGQANVESAMRAINSGEIYRFLTKPWDDVELSLVIRGALEKYNLQEQNRRLLDLVKRQKISLERIESKHPGITSLERDAEGHMVIPDVDDDDIYSLMTVSETGRRPQQ